MFSLLMFIAGLAVGAAVVQFGVPLATTRFPALARFARGLPSAALLPTTLRAKIDATIAELEGQVRDRVDVERNLTRLAQLRELIGGQQ